MKTDVVHELDLVEMRGEIMNLLNEWVNVVEGEPVRAAIIKDVEEKMETFLLNLKDMVIANSEIGYEIFIPVEAAKYMLRGNWPYVEDEKGDVYQVERQVKDGWFVHKGGANRVYLGEK
jgi:hypothetical protein